MRLAFLGTPEPAVPTLRALVDADHDVAIVITRPDRRRGRGKELSPSPVKAAAQELGLRVGHQLSELEGLSVERGVVVAYGALIPSSVLDVVPMLNVHFSLLPRWRGAAPVERAILAGDESTGV
jgi:methionyl-tRNA formyltransferase